MHSCLTNKYDIHRKPIQNKEFYRFFASTMTDIQFQAFICLFSWSNTTTYVSRDVYITLKPYNVHTPYQSKPLYIQCQNRIWHSKKCWIYVYHSVEQKYDYSNTVFDDRTDFHQKTSCLFTLGFEQENIHIFAWIFSLSRTMIRRYSNARRCQLCHMGHIDPDLCHLMASLHLNDLMNI